jgi:FixJ family two-component response regulator
VSSGPEPGQPVRRLAVVDDDTLVREALRTLLPAHLRTEVTARSVEELLGRGRIEVEVVVLDLKLAGAGALDGLGGNVLQGTRAIRVLAG